MSVEEAITKYLENTKYAIIGKMFEQQFYASGESAKSLHVQGRKLLGSLAWMIDGRGPGKMPPIDPIAKWLKIRNSSVSPWAVAKNIAKNGTLVWQGKRKPLDVPAAVEENKAELMRDIGESIRLGIVARLRQAKPNE